MQRAWTIILGLAAAIAAGCSGNSSSTPSGPSQSACANATPVDLAVGQDTVLDATVNAGCIALPAAGPGGAEHLVVAYSASGQITTLGISAPFHLSAGSAPSAAPMAGTAMPHLRGLQPDTRFDAMLRARGRALSASPALQGARARAPASGGISRATAPTLGSQRTFYICANANCPTPLVALTATAKHVGPHSAIYLDDSVPAGGYTQADLDSIGTLFDDYLYPIDTLSFGRESDLDTNGVVIVLMSPKVNDLSGNCNTTNSVILGYFFPDDLLPSAFDPNDGEIFYTLVPDPGNTHCTITKSFATAFLPSTFLHEFQHMISFNRHVLLAGGFSEDNWLDEGLSRLAEELGGREIPDAECPGAPSCLDRLAAGDVYNAESYLHKDTLEASFVFEPDNIDGDLAENGANWLWVRWLTDHFATDTILGRDFTRVLDGADQPGGRSLVGQANLEAATGQSMPVLLGQWQMANYLASVPTFTEPTGRLRYKSWDLDGLFVNNFGAYPLQPDSTTGSYLHSGVLRQGSGRHLRVIQPGSGAGVVLQLSDPNGAPLGAAVVPRIAVVRIR